MSLSDFRRELNWTRLFFIVLFFGIFFCDRSIHGDYDKFLAHRDDEKTLEARIGILEKKKTFEMLPELKEDCALRSEIMPACFKGRK